MSSVEHFDDIVRDRDGDLKYIVTRNLALLSCVGFWAIVAYFIGGLL